MILQDVVWEEPPMGYQSLRTRYRKALKALQAHPGKWGRVGDWPTPAQAQNEAYKLRRAIPEIETISRDGMVYARWKGCGEG